MSEDFDDEALPPITIAQQHHEKKLTEERSGDLLGRLLDHVSSDNYIPWEKVQLPSKGIYYDDKMPDGFIEVKPMGVDVDKMLTNQRLIQNGDLLNKIVEVCTKFPQDMGVRELIAGDFNFLLYYLRGITHGPIYEFSTECPHCGTKNMYNFDLGELSNTVKWSKDEYSEEPMSVELPKLSETFGQKIFALVRLTRVDDIMKMSQPGNDKIFDPVKQGVARIRNKNKQQQKKKVDDLSKIYDNSMKNQIIGFEIDGNRFIDSRRNQIIDRFHQLDTVTIREFIDEISPGIDTTLDVVCSNPECGKEAVISLPWNENFFRPGKKR